MSRFGFYAGSMMGGSRNGGPDLDFGRGWFRLGLAYQTGYDWELRQQLDEERYIFRALGERLPRWAEQRLIHGLFRVKLGWVWWCCFVPDLYLGRLKRDPEPARRLLREVFWAVYPERLRALDAPPPGWAEARKRGRT